MGRLGRFAKLRFVKFLRLRRLKKAVTNLWGYHRLNKQKIRRRSMIARKWMRVGRRKTSQTFNKLMLVIMLLSCEKLADNCCVLKAIGGI